MSPREEALSNAHSIGVVTQLEQFDNHFLKNMFTRPRFVEGAQQKEDSKHYEILTAHDIQKLMWNDEEED